MLINVRGCCVCYIRALPVKQLLLAMLLQSQLNCNQEKRGLVKVVMHQPLGLVVGKVSLLPWVRVTSVYINTSAWLVLLGKRALQPPAKTNMAGHNKDFNFYSLVDLSVWSLLYRTQKGKPNGPRQRDTIHSEAAPLFIVAIFIHHTQRR